MRLRAVVNVEVYLWYHASNIIQAILTPCKHDTRENAHTVANGAGIFNKETRALRSINPHHAKSMISPKPDLRRFTAPGGVTTSPALVAVTPDRLVGLWNNENMSPSVRSMLM